MKIEDKRKCKTLKALSIMEFGTVFKNGDEYYIVSDDGTIDGNDFNEDCDTQYCVNLETGAMKEIYIEDEFEVVKGKVVIE